MKKKDVCFLVGMFSGIVFGGIMILLYAPRSGEETRVMLRDKIKPVLRKIKRK